MIWLAIDGQGFEHIYEDKPFRNLKRKYWNSLFEYSDYVQLPSGTIKKLIGRNLTWNDEPVEIDKDGKEVEENAWEEK